MMEPDLDCVGPGELGGVVLYIVVARVFCVEGVGHGDGLVHSVTVLRVDTSLSRSGLTIGAAAASMLDLQQTAGATRNRLAAVHRHWLDSQLHLFPCWEKVTLGPRGWIEEVPDSIRNQDHLPPQEYLHHQ